MEHTSRHYERELQQLKEKILLLGGTVELMIASSMKSLLTRDSDLAKSVIASDPRVDAMELEVDHLCLSLLALRQPA
ncbi:MAG TPA: PhoU domain-containing protein, partial [Candidatus Polarisedimenticolia bacterium]|nr:PhoU domain-containing protein [Candidatus Polarisedimenticolia bacterium]